jgi:protoheme IX farnesyltransferase
MRPEVNSGVSIGLQRLRVLDYLTLTKPELTMLSVVTALAGCYLASAEGVPLVPMLHVLVGTILVGGGAGALNQFLEREFDGQMRRTENRPIPAGRIHPMEGLLFGILLAAGGVLYLTATTNMLTGFLAALTLTSYLFLYTPLKRITPAATLVGGIPGALPPVMGWTAVSNEISLAAVALFAILFCWQMPHFLSLAWMYKKDYMRAGYKVLAATDAGGLRTSQQILLYCAALIPASLSLAIIGTAGSLYGISAVVLGIVFLVYGLHLYHARTNNAARRVFFASLIYLPVLLLFMALDKA